MKKLLVVLSILFIGILLAGCTTQPTPIATPTPTPEPTAVPTTVVTTVPTEIPTTVVEVTTATPNSTPTPTPTPQPSVTITFNNDGTIKPGVNVVVPVGGKVIWLNNDAFKPHGIVAVNVGTGKYFGGMNSVNIPYGKTFEVTFDTVGSYDYQTVFQPSVTGKIIVTK
jgi:plastocyanin